MLGLTVSHYRITGKLGTGGMGIVYEADDLRLPRKVALKFLPDELADDADAVRRFDREAATIALLSHPNICTIYDVDTHEGRQFIAMERLDGVTLKTLMAREDLELGRLLDITRQITAALGAAHAKGIVHRDIKPGNVMVARRRAREGARLRPGAAVPPARHRTRPDSRAPPFRAGRWGPRTTWRRNGFSSCRWIREAICSRWA